MGSIKGKGWHDVFTEDKLIQFLYREESSVSLESPITHVTLTVAFTEKQNSVLVPSGSLKATLTPLLHGLANFIIIIV
jgi:hypothetical protein